MPTADPAPDDRALLALVSDARLMYLIGDYGYRECAFGRACAAGDAAGETTRYDVASDARFALYRYLAAHYVRRDRLYADDPHDSGDGSAYAAAPEALPDRATWPLRAMVGERRYGSDGVSGLYHLLDCGHESSALHGGPVERMADGRDGKRCRRCAEVIEHNERYDYDVRD